MHEILNSPTPRRGFLGRIAAFAAGMTLVTPAGVAAEIPKIDSAADPALDAWFGRIKGKHRVVFDAPAPNNGMAAVWPRVYMNTMAATYPGETTAVVIFRHEGLPLVLGDAIWSKYHLGEMFNVKDGTMAATRNPYATIRNIPLPGLGVSELLKSGVLVGACDVALTVYSAGAAQKMSMDPAAVKAEWIAGLLPGVQVVPSGVLGVAHAQELGCNYIFAG
jgi:intracellular sulfur oxidation DsrE/DsrF family protein